MKTTVVIPALNEEDAVGSLVTSTLKQPVDTVIVVDNASTDRTAQRACQAGAQVIAEPRRGYGYACAAGATAAKNADIIVFLDGDYSCLPEELSNLLAPLWQNEADLVIGSRELGHIASGAMPPHQRFGNWLMARLMNWLYGFKLTDLGPYRAIRRELLESLHMQEMTFGWPTEMTVKAICQQARVVEVPVSWHRRYAGQSKISGTVKGTVLAAYHIFRTTMRYARCQPTNPKTGAHHDHETSKI
jgi:glycosyltransferase involved in cell wall biosynthesis